MLQQIKSFIRTHQLTKPGTTVIVGVSGGPDSVAMLHLLYALRYELGIQLHVAHYNHNYRPGAAVDQRFVEGLAKKMNLPCTIGIWKNPPQNPSEDQARQQRLKFFASVAKKQKTNLVALAHTQDDLAETVLMRMIRGTGLQGLRGILPKKGVTSRHSTFLIKNVECRDVTPFLIRPVLGIRKQELLSYLKKHKIPFRRDPTNCQTKFLRNKIRLELLPLLAKEYNPKITETLAHLASNLETDYAHLQKETEKKFHKIAHVSPHQKQVSLNLKKLQQTSPALRRMLIRKAVESLQGNTNRLTLKHIQEVEELLHNGHTKAVVHLPKGLRVKKKGPHLNIEPKGV